MIYVSEHKKFYLAYGVKTPLGTISMFLNQDDPSRILAYLPVSGKRGDFAKILATAKENQTVAARLDKDFDTWASQRKTCEPKDTEGAGCGGLFVAGMGYVA